MDNVTIIALAEATLKDLSRWPILADALEDAVAPFDSTFWQWLAGSIRWWGVNGEGYTTRCIEERCRWAIKFAKGDRLL